MNFLPVNRKESEKLGYSELDVVIVSGDAYVDHPAFAAAIVGRYLQSLGLRVGIIPQPDWHSIDDFKVLGKPKMFFGVTAGNMDSMLSLYTSQRKIRSDDPYSEKGYAGRKPYLPTIVYTNRIKEAFKDVPVIIGGIEASLRRVAHYDFYTDKIRPSILLDSKADMLVYGNGEASLKEIVKRLKNGTHFKDIKNVRGTVVPLGQKEGLPMAEAVIIPSFEEVRSDKNAFNTMTRELVFNMNPYSAKPLMQKSCGRAVFINPPAFPLDTSELDAVYSLPYTRKPHPMYTGGIPALEIVEKSVTSHRGCYGGCNFCALYLHQGKFVQSRSAESVIKEISEIAEKSAKKITIADIGGPTANMYGTYCRNEKNKKKCKRQSCLYPTICKNLESSTSAYLKLLELARTNLKVKSVQINTGVRFDLALANPEFIDELVKHYVPGQLSVAPEHCADEVLRAMRKPKIGQYNYFASLFYAKCSQQGKNYYLIPYFMVGHPGADEKSERELQRYVKRKNIKTNQIQEFYPTPMTVSTAMYCTGMNPFTNEPVSVQKKIGIKKKWKVSLIHAMHHFV